VRDKGPRFKNLISSKGITLIFDVMMAFSVLLFVAIIRVDNYAESGFVVIGLGALYQKRGCQKRVQITT
jgi:hypothetical protein